jgi:hypothetical protein
MWIKFVVAPPHEPSLVAHVEVLDHEPPSREQAPSCESTEEPHMFARWRTCGSRLLQYSVLLGDPLNDEHRDAKASQHVREEDQVRSRIGVRTIGWWRTIHISLRNSVTWRSETRRGHCEGLFLGELLKWCTITYMVKLSSFYELECHKMKTCSLRAKGSICCAGNVS